MRSLTRKLIALLLTLLLGWFLVETCVGPVMSDCVGFYGPIVLGAYFAWNLKVRRRSRAHSYTFLTGVIGGLIATLIWPTGILIVMILTGLADPHLQAPLVLLFACFFVGSLLGGVVAMLLSLAFGGSLPAVKLSKITNDNPVGATNIEPWVESALRLAGIHNSV